LGNPLGLGSNRLGPLGESPEIFKNGLGGPTHVVTHRKIWAPIGVLGNSLMRTPGPLKFWPGHYSGKPNPGGGRRKVQKAKGGPQKTR